jgi:hypothetical protein
MAIRPEDTYASTTPGDADYPFGSSKNETAPGMLDGTPLEKAVYNDWLGFFQSLVTAAGITPTNSPDTVLLPQYLESIFNLRYYAPANYSVGTKLVGSDGETYKCIGANGPATSVQDPVTEGSPRTKWLTEAAAIFDVQHPVGSYWFSEVNSSPEDFLGVGTWARTSMGRMVVGLNEGDTDFDTPGETGGSKLHTHTDTLAVDGHSLTVAELPATAPFTLTSSNGSAGSVVPATSNPLAGTDAGSGIAASNNIAWNGDGDTHTHVLSGLVEETETLPPYQTTYIWKRTA